MQSSKLKLIISVVCLALILCAGYFFWIKKQNGNPAALGAKNPVEVTVVTIAKEQVQLFQELPGRVASYRISPVRPQIEGVIKERKFEEGSFVEKGQQLYQIDPTIYDISLKNTKASFSAMRARRDRYKSLLEDDAISKQEFDDIQADFAKAEADFKKAQTNISYTKVLAPISGYIGKSNITEGALVTANQSDALTTITQLDPIYIDMVLPSKDIIRLGDQKEIPVDLTLDDPTYQNLGTLKFSEMFADESTDSVRLRAQFSNQDKKLLPGMFVSARLHLKPFSAITVLQRVASRSPKGTLFVWIVDKENTVHQKEIKAEQSFEDRWIVLEGLEEGDLVVYEGSQKITEGAKVNPIPANPPTQSPSSNKQ